MTVETGNAWVADDFALEDLIKSKSWAFANVQAGTLLAPRIVFESGGKLCGYDNPNEAGWRISDGALELLTQEGRISTRFNRHSLSDGKLVLEGQFQLCEGGAAHVLIETGDVPRVAHRTAVIIPIHQPYFKYGINFLYQAMGGDFDVVLVFSSEAERAQFATMHQASPAMTYRAIVLADHVCASALDTMAANRNWITSKKFLALWLLQKHYDYFVCVDAETFLLSPRGWEQAARQTLEAGVWHAGTSPAPSDSAIMRHSALSMAPVADHARLAEVTQDWALYSWWWDLPVYAAAHLPGFFDWTDWSPTRASVARYGFDAFDHLVYQAYTVLHAGFHYQHVSAVSHSLEFARADVVTRVHSQVAPMRWTNAFAYAQQPEFFRDNDYLAVYHLDRLSFPQYTP